MSDIFINQTFKVYQTNQQIQFDDAQAEFLKLNLAKYIFQRYITTTGDIIPRFQDYQEIYLEITIKNEKLVQSNYNINYLQVKGPLILRSLYIFINKNQTTIMLQKLVKLEISVSEVIFTLFESLPDLSIPLVIQTNKIDNIETIVNNLFGKVSTYGDFTITYNLNHQDINSNLKKIKLNIPEHDIQSLSTDQPVLTTINQFLYNTSKIKFNNLSIVEFSSGLINIIHDGKFRINGEKLMALDDDMKQESVWLIIESLVT